MTETLIQSFLNVVYKIFDFLVFAGNNFVNLFIAEDTISNFGILCLIILGSCFIVLAVSKIISLLWGKFHVK